MASPSAVELARGAQQEIAVLRAEFEAFAKNAATAEVRHLLERVATIEEKVSKLEAVVEALKQLPVIDDRVNKLEKRAEKLDELHQKAAVTDDRVNKLEKREEESGKRGWQFVFIAAGAGLALLSSFLVQLVFYFIKK